MRRSLIAAAVGLAMVAGGCGSGGSRNDAGSATTVAPAATTVAPAATTAAPATTGAPSGSTSQAPTTEMAKDPCAGVTLEATDTGITADTITLMVMADTGSPLAPGLAQGAVDAMKGWVERANANGGGACRTIVLETYDSKLDANEVRNGYTKGCESAFAMVGTYSLFVADISALSDCPDKTGAKIGIPETPAVIQSTLQACNPSTFGVNNLGEPCPPKDGVRELHVQSAPGNYIRTIVGENAHGMYLYANATPTLIQSAMATFRYMQKDLGLTADAEGGAASSDTQDHFTPFATTMKDKGSNFVFSQPNYNSFLGLYKEAKAQGVDTVKLWLCGTTCYDPAFLKAGGADVEGVQSYLNTLPYEEESLNAELQDFVKYSPTKNNFAINAWIAADLFATAVDAVVAEKGPNGITRAAVIEALGKIKDFDAGGLIGPSTPADRNPGRCLVIVEVQDGAYRRAYPTEPGKFFCTDLGTITLDPAAEAKG